MSSDTALGGIADGRIALAAFGLVLVVFAIIPETRSLALVLLWLLGPAVAYGSIVQVMRGRLDVRSGRGIVFALVCGFFAFVTIFLEFVVVSEPLSQALTFFGLVSAIVAVAFTYVSVNERSPETDRDVPPIDPDEFADGGDGVR